ncbi:TPA: tyrosine-type recombinase/integrase [Pseudomonas aeruginosa]
MTNLVRQQLFKPLKELTLFSYHAHGDTVTKDGSGLPFCCWPDGTPNNVANLYMLALRDRPGRSGKGLSRHGGKGGSIGEYASKISPLVRYCYTYRTDFIELSDQQFSDFISNLRKEKSANDPTINKRTETTLLTIGRVCLDFLQFVGRLHGDDTFVSENGTIRAVMKSITITTRSGRTIKRSYLHHHSLHISGTRYHTRDPIPSEHVMLLRDAVNRIHPSRNLQLRRNLMISLLEHTGARRSEIIEITVSDIRNAMNMAIPMLRLRTLKRGSYSERYIPISRVVLTEALKYIKVARKKSLRNFSNKDHDKLFVQEKTGKPLGAGSITNEIIELRRYAGIEEKACAHMFRHAFITNLFVLLIKRHRFKQKDDFRSALLNSRKFLYEVMTWTGHRDPTSVEKYIHLAFSKLDGYEEIVSSAHIIRTTRAYDQAEEILLNSLKNGMPVEEYAHELENLKKLKKEDFKNETGEDGSELKASREHWSNHL